MQLAYTYGAERDAVDEDRITDVLYLRPDATPAERDAAARKAEAKLFIKLMNLWGRGKIPGRETAHSLEQDARRADALATMMERACVCGHQEKSHAENGGVCQRSTCDCVGFSAAPNREARAQTAAGRAAALRARAAELLLKNGPG